MKGAVLAALIATTALLPAGLAAQTASPPEQPPAAVPSPGGPPPAAPAQPGQPAAMQPGPAMDATQPGPAPQASGRPGPANICRELVAFLEPPAPAPAASGSPAAPVQAQACPDTSCPDTSRCRRAAGVAGAANRCRGAAAIARRQHRRAAVRTGRPDPVGHQRSDPAGEFAGHAGSAGGRPERCGDAGATASAAGAATGRAPRRASRSGRPEADTGGRGEGQGRGRRQRHCRVPQRRAGDETRRRRLAAAADRPGRSRPQVSRAGSAALRGSLRRRPDRRIVARRAEKICQSGCRLRRRSLARTWVR